MTRKPAPATALVGLALAAGILAGCTSGSQNDSRSATRSGSDITVAGSTALLPLVKEASAAYQEAHKDVKISVSGGGSATGIAQVAGKAIDIGDSDITAPEHPELHDNRVAVVGFAIAAHPSAGVVGVTRAQLRDIFAGKIVNWKQVGGADQAIVVVNRPRSSGTRAVFVKTIMGTTPLTESGPTEDATGTVVAVVKQTPGTVTYVSLSGLTGGDVRVLAIDGVAPTTEHIVSGKYPIWSYEHMFTNGAPTGSIADFITFVQHQNGLLKKSKFIAVGDMRVTENDR